MSTPIRLVASESQPAPGTDRSDPPKSPGGGGYNGLGQSYVYWVRAATFRWRCSSTTAWPRSSRRWTSSSRPRTTTTQRRPAGSGRSPTAPLEQLPLRHVPRALPRGPTRTSGSQGSRPRALSLHRATRCAHVRTCGGPCCSAGGDITVKCLVLRRIHPHTTRQIVRQTDRLQLTAEDPRLFVRDLLHQVLVQFPLLFLLLLAGGTLAI